MDNSGEQLILRDEQGAVVDTASAVDGGWPAGIILPVPSTMERQDPTGPDAASNWCTNDGITKVGQDVGGNAIMGTPRARNSCYREPSDPGSSLRHLPLVVRGYTPPRTTSGESSSKKRPSDIRLTPWRSTGTRREPKVSGFSNAFNMRGTLAP